MTGENKGAVEGEESTLAQT